MALNIVRVNALPDPVAASTIYLVKGSASDAVDIYVTSEDGLQVRHVPTKDEILSGVILYSTVAPALPSATPLWYDISTLTLFVQYNDGTTTAWVEAIPSIAVPDFAGNGTANTMARSDHTHNSIEVVLAEW